VIDTSAPKNDEKNVNYGVRMLYYYSPEEYEKHQNITVSPESKEKWQHKFMVANRRFNK
jgi:agmatine/peptidylarginine deiminase